MNITQTESIVYGLLLTLVIALSLSWLLRSKIPQTRSQKMNELMNNYFEKYGLERKPTEGPEAWKNRTLASFPENSRKIQALFSCYIAEAYENKQSRSNLNRIKQLLRSL